MLRVRARTARPCPSSEAAVIATATLRLLVLLAPSTLSLTPSMCAHRSSSSRCDFLRLQRFPYLQGSRLTARPRSLPDRSRLHSLVEFHPFVLGIRCANLLHAAQAQPSLRGTSLPSSALAQAPPYPHSTLLPLQTASQCSQSIRVSPCVTALRSASAMWRKSFGLSTTKVRTNSNGPYCTISPCLGASERVARTHLY